MRFICNDCGEIFDEEDAATIEVDLESVNGVGGLFPDHHYSTILVCPECGSECLDDYTEESEEEDGEDETE